MTVLLDEVIAILQSSGLADATAEAGHIVRAAAADTPTDYANVARTMAQRRAAGMPLAYVIGRKMFMGIELIAAEGTLAPREETELLGMTALDTLRLGGSQAHRLIDMCCGSGNLACAIASHLPGARIWASDLTDDCVALARRNAVHTGVSDRVVVAQGDLFASLAGFGLEGSIDLVVCNPPYISQGKLVTERAPLLDHEPREAFDGGPYGLSIHQRVVREALPFLRPGGSLLVEIGLGQERQVKILFDRTKAYEDVRLIANPAGDVRVAAGRKRVE